MSETIEQKCISKGVKLTDQRRIIAKVMSESQDHPDVDELYNRVSEIDSKISIATVYRTVKLFEEAGIVAKHDFKGGKARYEQLSESHHDHLIDIKTGEIIEFVDDEIEKLQKKENLEGGFLEKPDHCEKFFRSGKSGEGLKKLNDMQIEKIVKKFSSTLKKFDYLN